MTPEAIRDFLVTSPVFADVAADQLEQVARLMQVQTFSAGQLILQQGGFSPAVYFLRSGRLAVRVQRGEWRETIAFIQPPEMVGELSFVTGRPCSADVEVVVDAELVSLSKEAVPKLPQQREALLRGLMKGIAERLHTTTTRGTKVTPAPVVLLLRGNAWDARESFSPALLESVARQTGRPALWARIGQTADSEPSSCGENAGVCTVRSPDPAEMRATIARRITDWKTRYDTVLLDPSGPEAAAVCGEIAEFADIHGYLLGPDDPVPASTRESDFIVQSAAKPSLPALTGRHQLLFDCPAAETAVRGALPPRFQRTVDSIARAIGGIQVGLALGGGAAWGWAHIGVLEVLYNAGIPVDTISGCSMGSVIGALHCGGHSVESLKEIAAYWKSRTKRFIEWRIWRMCLLNEKVVRKVFGQYFGERGVNEAEIPYWANAVDIQTGKEFTIRDGSLVDCVRASIALPGLLPPAPREKHLLVDAGIMDPVPVHLARDMGTQFNIAVNAMAAMEKAPLSRMYPFNAFDVMTRCMFLMGHEIGQARAEQVANVLFTPSLGDITMLQFGRSAEIIECGRKAAEEHLDTIVTSYERLKKSRTVAKTAAAAKL